jgi:hypothetical protein
MQVKTKHVRDKRVEFIAPTAKIGIVTIAGWTRMLKQNPTTGIYLLLHELFREGFRSFEDKLSSENIMNWHAFGVQMKPTTGISARRANY